MKLTVEFQDICVHFGMDQNRPLPVPYRVIAPHQDSLSGEVLEFFLGSLHPSVKINEGEEHHGPLRLTIGEPVPSPRKTPATGLPSLSSLLVQPIEVEHDLAYGDRPPGKTCFIDLHLPGEFQLEPDHSTTVMKAIFTTESSGPIDATLEHDGKVSRFSWSSDTTVRVRNTPAQDLRGFDPAHQILLGVLAINRSIPLADLISVVDLDGIYLEVNQPGCSNSQWP